MQGSLIFVVIVAVWAAYLVQHWVRRREEAAEVRSVAGFSQAMRVLKKRPLLPSTELAAPRPHSYTLTPGRSGRSGLGAGVARSTVEVKRAAPVGAARPASALTARSTVTTQRSDLESASMTASLTRTDPAEVEPMPNTLAPQHPSHSGQRQPAPGRPAADTTAVRRGSAASGGGSRGSSGSSQAQRRLRAALLLISLLWVPVSIVLAAMSLLTWFSVPFALLTVAAVLFWLRTEAAADRATRLGRVDTADGADGFVASLDRAPVISVDDTQAVATHAYAASEQSGAHGAVDAAAVVAAGEQAEPAARRAAFFDGQASETAAASARAAVAASATTAPHEALPGTWSPVPVPRPTYSLKAKAAPRMTEGGIPADVFATPEFADEADELDERALFARRAASG